MNILVVDDEKLALEDLCDAIKACIPTAEVDCFMLGVDGALAAKSKVYDVVFLDVEMRDIGGLEVAQIIKGYQPQINIIFVTGHDKYALQAFGVHASGYLLKPVNKKQVKDAIDHLRNPISSVKSKGLWVQCFGNFEVFYDGKPLKFTRQKSKEMFAYLIDRRGAQITMSQMASILWEDGMYNKSRNNQMLTFLYALTKLFQNIGESDVIIHYRNSLAVDVSKLNCDYYEYLNNSSLKTASCKEYMSQYWWSEFTGGSLF